MWPTPPKECSEFLQRLAASGRPTRDLVACVIGLAVGSSVNYAQAVAQVVDFYLGDDRAQERAALINICKRDDAKSKELLRGYVREAMRLNPQFGGLFRVAVQDDVVPQGTGFQPLQVKTGDILFAGFKNAHLNVSLPSPLLSSSPPPSLNDTHEQFYTMQPADFPNPTAVDPTRPKDSYQLQGAGFHNCPGVDFAADTIPEIIKIIFTLPGLRRAPNPAGTCASFNLNKLGTDNKMYVTSTGNWSPWPGSLIVAVSSAFCFLSLSLS